MSGAGRDPGLQPERTKLAWRRTTLSCTVAAMLAVRQALHSGGATPAAGVAVALSAAAWLGFLWVAHRRTTGMGVGRPQPLSPRGALTATACTVALAVFAAAAMF